MWLVTVYVNYEFIFARELILFVLSAVLFKFHIMFQFLFFNVQLHFPIFGELVELLMQELSRARCLAGLK